MPAVTMTPYVRRSIEGNFNRRKDFFNGGGLVAVVPPNFLPRNYTLSLVGLPEKEDYESLRSQICQDGSMMRVTCLSKDAYVGKEARFLAEYGYPNGGYFYGIGNEPAMALSRALTGHFIFTGPSSGDSCLLTIVKTDWAQNLIRNDFLNERFGQMATSHGGDWPLLPDLQAFIGLNSHNEALMIGGLRRVTHYDDNRQWRLLFQTLAEELLPQAEARLNKTMIGNLMAGTWSQKSEIDVSREVNVRWMNLLHHDRIREILRRSLPVDMEIVVITRPQNVDGLARLLQTPEATRVQP